MKRSALCIPVSILPLLCQSHAATILMDYNDGNATNGIHDTNVNNGDIGTQDWTGNHQYATTTNSGIGSNQNLIMGVDRISAHTLATVGYSAKVGDVISSSFMWAPAANWDAADRPVFSIYYTSDDTLLGSGRVNLFSFSAPTAGGALGEYRVEGVPDHTISDTGAVGKTFFIELANNNTITSSEFYRADNIFVSVEPVPEPSVVALLGLGGLCLLHRRR